MEKSKEQGGLSAGLGLQLGLIGLLGLAVAAMSWLALESCGAEGGCVEGARGLWRAAFPDWARRAIRSIFHVVTAPWLWFAIVVAGIGERLRPARSGQPILSMGMVHDGLAWVILNRLTFGLLVGIVFSYSYLVDLYDAHLSFLSIQAMTELPTAVRAGLAFLLADFLGWFHHWVRHKVPAFWVFHAVHHSQREMNLFTDERVHPFDRLIAMPIWLIPMLVLELDGQIVPWLLVFQTTHTHLYHANLKTDYGLLRYVFVTPQSHRVHHSHETQHADTNFGVIFCIWDRIFGTHVDSWSDYPQTGIEDPDFPMEKSTVPQSILFSYLQQFFYPFKQIWIRATTGSWQLPAG